MARINNLIDFLTDIANAIKNKKGDTTDIPASEFDTEIINLPSQGIYQSKQVNISTNGNYIISPDNGYDAIKQLIVMAEVPAGTDTSDATAIAKDVLEDKTAYVNGEKITGTVKNLKGSGISLPIQIHDGYLPNTIDIYQQFSLGYAMINNDTSFQGQISYSSLASLLNVTADKIKKGEIILGITGIYDGSEEDLPYTELVYIQSTGSQYIDTGIKVKSTLNIKTEFEATDNGSVFQSVFGGDGGSSRSYRGLAFDINSEGQFNYNFYGNTIASVLSLQRYNNVLIFESRYNSAMITSNSDKRSQVIRSTQTTAFTYDDVNVYLFARCRDNAPICHTILKLYYFKIWDNETLLRDFIPVEDENGQVCMYDKVSKTYFYNVDSSQGDFIVGPIKNAGDYSYVKTFEMDNGKSTDGYSPMVDVYSKGGNLSLLIIRNISSVDTLHVWFEGDEDTDMNISPKSKSEYLYESNEPASNIDVTHMHNVSSFDWIQPT